MESPDEKAGCLDSAERLEDLRIPPGNRLGQLSGKRAGQHNIRVSEEAYGTSTY